MPRLANELTDEEVYAHQQYWRDHAERARKENKDAMIRAFCDSMAEMDTDDYRAYLTRVELKHGDIDSPFADNG